MYSNFRRSILTLLTISLAGCASLTSQWKAPEVALAHIQVRELTLGSQTFLTTLRIKNPNDRALPIKAMTYTLKLEGNELAEGGGKLDRQIPAFGEEMVDVQVTGNLLAIAQFLPALAIQEEPVHWTVSGTATIADGLLTLPYRHSGKVDPDTLLGSRR